MRESLTTDGYFNKDFNAYMVSVAAGFFAWSRSPQIALTTTLGSCVSVCVCDTHSKIGGMNHFLLPEGPETGSVDRSEAARYGSAAIEILLNALYTHGASKNDLLVKVFGGGKVIAKVSADVGKRNAEFAKNFFRNERIRIASEDTGGFSGRKVIFFPATGRALVRQVEASADLTDIAATERKRYQELQQSKVEGDIELF